MIKHELKVAMESILPNEIGSEISKSFGRQLEFIKAKDFRSVISEGGFFVEAGCRALQFFAEGKFTKFEEKIEVEKELLRLESFPENALSKNFRLLVTRAFRFIYGIRNHRGGGHLRAETGFEKGDADIVINISKWIVRELLKIDSKKLPEKIEKFLEENHAKRGIINGFPDGSKKIMLSGLRPSEKILAFLDFEKADGVALADLRQMTKLPQKKLVAAIGALASKGHVHSNNSVVYITEVGRKYCGESEKMKLKE